MDAEPRCAEQNETVGHQWGKDGNEKLPGERTSDTFVKTPDGNGYFKPDRLPIDQDPSWWAKHWESGEDLHYPHPELPEVPETVKIKLKF